MRFYILTVLLLAAGCTTRQVSNNAVAVPSPAEEPASKASTNAATPRSSLQPSLSQTPLQFEEADIKEAANVIHQYYTAINSINYRKAYELWSDKGQASKQTFDQFQQGFADTASVTVEIGKPGDIEGAAGSRFITIPVTLEAKTKSGARQNFAGEYVLRRSVVDGASAEQRAWRIYSSKINRK